MNAIEICNITKSYHGKKVLCGINLSIPQGGVYALIGPNGSGKTTLLRILAGLAKPTGGKLSIFSHPVKQGGDISNVSFMFEPSPLDGMLTACQNLKLRCIAVGAPIKQVFRLLEQVGLKKDNKLVKDYSAGMKKRLELAYALLGSPELLVLDEPFNGLDVFGIELLSDVVYQYKKQNATVLIAENNISVVEKLADYFAILYDGRIIKTIRQAEIGSCEKDIAYFLKESIGQYEKSVKI